LTEEEKRKLFRQICLNRQKKNFDEEEEDGFFCVIFIVDDVTGSALSIICYDVTGNAFLFQSSVIVDVFFSLMFFLDDDIQSF
jgi:hypothetical protein